MGYMDVLNEVETQKTAKFTSRKVIVPKKNYELIFIIMVIILFAVVMTNKIAEVNFKLNVESDFSNAQTIASSIIQAIYDDEDGVKIKNLGKLESKKRDAEPEPLSNISEDLVKIYGELPKIKAQEKGKIWSGIIDATKGIVRIYAGDVQLYPRLNEYEYPYNTEQS